MTIFISQERFFRKNKPKDDPRDVKKRMERKDDKGRERERGRDE